jgi:hypothetical protein
MAITVLPQFRNPWVESLPGYMQNMVLQRLSQKFRAGEAEKQREFEKEQSQLSRSADVEAAKLKAKQPSFGSVAGEENVWLYDKKTGDIKKTEIPVGAKGLDKLVRGKDFYWRYNNGVMTKTEIPVPPKSKTQLSVDKDGRITFTQGDVGELTPTNVTAVQKDLIGINDRMGRLSNIITKYKSDYQNVWTKIGFSYDALKDMTGIGKKLTPEQRKGLQEYSSYRKEAVREFGLEIQRLAKGNLTKNEAKLYGKGLPNPGTGWFDGDSPAEFEGALRTSYKNLDKIRARKHYYLNRLNYTQAQIDTMLENESILSVDAFMQKADEAALAKENELVKQLQASGEPIDEGQIKAMVKKFLMDEFGFRF